MSETGSGSPVPPQPPTQPGWTTATAAPVVPARPQTSNNAIAALVLAIVAWLVFPVVPAIVALVLASKAQREIEASNGWVTGDGMVLGARIASWINIGFYALATIALVVVLILVAVNA